MSVKRLLVRSSDILRNFKNLNCFKDKGEYMFPEKTIREIFMNTHELQNLHEVLRNKLKDRIENWYVSLFRISYFIPHFLNIWDHEKLKLVSVSYNDNSKQIILHFWIRLCTSTHNTRERSLVPTVGVSSFFNLTLLSDPPESVR